MLFRVEEAEDGAVTWTSTLRWGSRSRPGCGWLRCFLTSWMLSLGVSGVRTLGSVMLAPGGGADGWGRQGKEFLLDGERDRSGLLGVTLRAEPAELGA